MSEVGYVRIHRALLGHPAFRNDAESMAFAWLVLRASWRPVRVRYKERTIDLKRGQLAVSVRDMACALDRDKAWVERLWKRLKSETMIETVSETGVTVVTICKYDDYQAQTDNHETLLKTARETGARQGQDTEQGREEGKKEESSDSSPPNPQAKAEFRDAVKAQIKAKIIKAKPAKPALAAIPEWMPLAQWEAYLEMRDRKGKKPTGHAIGLLISKIDTFRQSGCDPGKILDQSTLQSWTDVYQIKEQCDDQRQPRTSLFADQRESTRETAERIAAELLRASPIFTQPGFRN